jgi:hypothetical protein
MPYLERKNPETPCQPNGAHHPHRLVCSDPDDDCWDEWQPGKFGPYNRLACCVCDQDWPCETKRAHIQEHATRPTEHEEHQP